MLIQVHTYGTVGRYGTYRTYQLAYQLNVCELQEPVYLGEVEGKRVAESYVYYDAKLKKPKVGAAEKKKRDFGGQLLEHHHENTSRYSSIEK